MKYFILITIIFLTINANVFSQGLIEYSIYNKVHIVTSERSINKYEYEYNDSEYVTKKNTSVWNEEADTWEPYFLNLYYYDETGYLSESKLIYYDKETKEYSKIWGHNLYQYEYNNLGQPITMQPKRLIFNFTPTKPNSMGRKEYENVRKGCPHYVTRDYNWVLRNSDKLRINEAGQEIIELPSRCDEMVSYVYELDYSVGNRYIGFTCYQVYEEEDEKIFYSEISHKYYNSDSMKSNETDDLDFRISPNPVSSFLNISINTGSKRLMTLEIFNYKGEKVMQETINTASNETLKYNTEGFAPGFYIAVIKGESNYSVKKFVKTDAAKLVIRP